MTLQKTNSATAEPLDVFEGRHLLNHDLRSAVSDVIGGLRLLNIAVMSPQNRTQIDRISASADLVLRLLDAVETGDAEITDRDASISLETVNVNTLLKDLIYRWQGRAADKGLELVLQVQTAPASSVLGNKLELERLLSNLLENAIKFSDQGKITLTVSQDATAITFAVQDNGPGFSCSALDKLFSYGGRPDDSPKPGSGLGLYIAQKVATKLAGKITVQNNFQGASVVLQLPLGPKTAAVLPEQSASPLRGKKVLLAEDNKTNQLVAGQMLSALGAEVVVVRDGVEAWDSLQDLSFDLAILDIEMPRKTGLVLIREIRAAEPALANMPLIALTAYAMREHRSQILAAGADGIIAKPLASIEDFGQQILRFCEKYNATPPSREPTTIQIGSEVDMQVFEALRETVGADSFGELLDKLYIDLMAVGHRLKHSFEDHDFDELRSASHVLISLAGAVGATGLLDVSQALNTAAHHEDCEKVADYESISLELLDKLTEFLQTVINNQSEG